MAELVARGPGGNERRWPLLYGTVTLGRTEASDWEVPWDQEISSRHAVLTWNEDRLAVTRLRQSRNRIFSEGKDQDFTPFSISIGESFVIGKTTFKIIQARKAVVAKAEDLPVPHSELTLNAFELRQVKYIDADERIEALTALPDLIRHSPSDADLEAHVLAVLLRGVQRCAEVGVVRLRPRDAAEVEVKTTAARHGQSARLLISRRLVRDALGRQQSVLYRWDSIGAKAADFTVHAAVDWAICAPLPDTPAPGWGLYLVGQSSGLASEEMFKGDLKFVQAVAAIFGSLRQLRDLQAERTQVQASLNIAHEIQAGFLSPQMPRIAGYEVAARSQPAEATGGDYCDVIPLPSGRVGLVIGDVTGHGLGPSLLMASVRALLRGFAVREPRPEELLTDLTAAMYDDLRPRHRFITFLYGVLDSVGHLFHYANAGHGPLVLHYRAAKGGFRSLLDDEARGCPLGILRETYQACAPLTLAPGDLLLLGSDGIVEARRDREQFGMVRLQELVLKHKDRPLPELLDTIFQAATDFEEGGQPDDDLTLVILRRTEE